MSRPTEGLSDFLTFISPICIIVLFFLCLFRFLFSCCACKFKSSRRSRRDSANDMSVESGIMTNSMLTSANALNMTSLPLSYIEYDTSCSIYPASFLFSADRFPPKYEDAIKLPNATPRRSSCSALPPPPFYDGQAADFTNSQPPAYFSLSTQGTGIRPTASGISTVSGQNTTGNAFLVAIPSPSIPTSPPLELSPSLLAEKRLRVGLNAVRHASLSAQDELRTTHTNRPITSLRTRDLSSTNNNQQRPFTTNSRYLSQITLPGQIAEASSTQSLNGEPLNENSDSEKTGQ